MITFPNAKINLGLNIVGRRPDGYHNIETVFYPVPLHDALEIVESKAFTFTQTGMEMNTPAEENLVVRALRRFTYPLPPLEVHLLKKIPFGAGLGGGSSDAAFMLKMLNQLGNVNLSDEQLEEIASGLGADCPFFIRNKPAFASGTGSILEPLDFSLKSCYITIVKPPVAVSTAEAYAGITPRQPARSIREIIRTPMREWKYTLGNDFEDSIFARYPEIGRIKKKLYDAGAVYASMSGSGSSVFALFEQPVNGLDFPNCFLHTAQLQ
jgi:4-diphosphocytidyl-2-C-methyl-D-erythritol kinase